VDTANFINNFVINFTAIVWEALPFIVLGALIAGILEEILPQQAIAKILPKHFLPATIIGGLLGLVFPMCECGIVVVMRRLLRKGLPLSSCVSYMLAGPILNVIVIMSTWYAFKEFKVGENQQSLGLPMVALRCGIGFLVAVTTGIVVHFVQKSTTKPLLTKLALPDAPKAKPKLSLNLIDDSPSLSAKKKSLVQRLNNISSTALRDFMDITVFLIIGSALAAFVKSDPDWIRSVETISQQQPYLAIPAMMILAVALCLCSEADAFLAASFTGMSVSAKIAFLVLGPMFDLKLLLMYTQVFRVRLIVTIVACTSIQVALYSFAVHQFYNPSAPGTPGASIAKP
jgi:uncharacterized membrane protein YraQ (UPF0718 family)